MDKHKTKMNSRPKSFLQADEQDESQLSKNAIGDLRSFYILLGYAKKYRVPFFLSLFLIVVSGVLSITAARFMGELVEQGLYKKDFDATLFFGASIIGLELLALSFLWGGSRWLAITSSKTILLIREYLFEHLQKIPMSYYDRQPQGRIVTRLTHDIEGLEEFFTSSLGRLSNAFFMAMIAMVAMLITNFFLGAILILSIIPSVLFIFFTRQKVRTVFREISKFSSSLNAKLSEFLNGIDVIRGYGLEHWSLSEYNKNIKSLLHSNLRANTFFAWSRPLVSFLCVMPLIGLVWFGGNQVLAGTLTIGIFVTFIRYYERFYMPVLTLAREIHVIQQAFTSAERVASFLSVKTEDEVMLGKQCVHIDKHKQFRGEIVFDQVWMNYDNESTSSRNSDSWVLRNVSFRVAPGEKIGLVGHTGCGKTTTVSLLSRLYEFQRGEIFIDGHSIRDYFRDDLRNNIGVVSQDAVIFRDTLRKNLSTNSSVSDEKILKACDLTGLSQVMSENQLSLNSIIFEGGSNLSGGQRQLVALTRVLINDPKILIMDEATANIDPYYEKLIHDAVKNLMQGRTCLVIAHRLETLDMCDRIFVFSHGQLVEEGPMDELIKQKGHFHRLKNAKSANKRVSHTENKNVFTGFC